MGARGRDFLLGIRRGQPAGAQVQSWCSWHGCVIGRSRQAGSHGQLTQALIPSRYRCVNQAVDGGGRQGRFQARRCDTGIPSLAIWLSTEQPTRAWVFWAGSVRREVHDR